MPNFKWEKLPPTLIPPRTPITLNIFGEAIPLEVTPTGWQTPYQCRDTVHMITVDEHKSKAFVDGIECRYLVSLGLRVGVYLANFHKFTVWDRAAHDITDQFDMSDYMHDEYSHQYGPYHACGHHYGVQIALDGSCWRYHEGSSYECEHYSEFFKSDVKPTKRHFRQWVRSTMT